jgi:hypothetical protein
MASSLTPKEKLRALGVAAPSIQNNPYLTIFAQIEDSKTYSTFSDDVNNDQSSFSDFETYLTDTIGVNSTDATQFRSKMEQKYSSFSDFQSTLSGFSSYDEWIETFSWGTTIAGDTINNGGEGGGELAAGIRIHGEAGVSKAGVDVPKGTLEAFAPRIEFSETDAPIDASTSFSAANLTISNVTPIGNETVTISADITNNSGYVTNHTTKLTFDNAVIDTSTDNYDTGETKTISFTYTFTEQVTVDVKVDSAGPQAISVVPDTIKL